MMVMGVASSSARIWLWWWARAIAQARMTAMRVSDAKA